MYENLILNIDSTDFINILMKCVGGCTVPIQCVEYQLTENWFSEIIDTHKT